MTSSELLLCAKLRNLPARHQEGDIIIITPFYRWGVIYFSKWLQWTHQLIQQNWDRYRLNFTYLYMLNFLCLLSHLGNPTPLPGVKGMTAKKTLCVTENLKSKVLMSSLELNVCILFKGAQIPHFLMPITMATACTLGNHKAELRKILKK